MGQSGRTAENSAMAGARGRAVVVSSARRPGAMVVGSAFPARMPALAHAFEHRAGVCHCPLKKVARCCSSSCAGRLASSASKRPVASCIFIPSSASLSALAGWRHICVRGFDAHLHTLQECVAPEPALGHARAPSLLYGGTCTASDESGDAFFSMPSLARMAVARGAGFIWNAAIQRLLPGRGKPAAVVVRSGVGAGSAL